MSPEKPQVLKPDQDWLIYKIRDSVPSFDKGGHKERSLVNQPNHRKHWKKKNGN